MLLHGNDGNAINLIGIKTKYVSQMSLTSDDAFSYDALL